MEDAPGLLLRQSHPPRDPQDERAKAGEKLLPGLSLAQETAIREPPQTGDIVLHLLKDPLRVQHLDRRPQCQLVEQLVAFDVAAYRPDQTISIYEDPAPVVELEGEQRLETRQICRVDRVQQGEEAATPVAHESGTGNPRRRLP